MATLLAMAIVWEFTLDPIVGLVNKLLSEGCSVTWFYNFFTGSWFGFDPTDSWYGNACMDRMPNWLGNKKYALEAENMLNAEIQNISINGVYSSSNPGKLLHSVISGPYENRSAANNAKEKITKKGFDPQLRTSCEQT